MLEQMEKYFEAEYKDAERVITQKVWWAKPNEIVNNTTQRMLGVAFFAQRVDYDLSSNAVENLYNEYKEKLEKLLTD